MTIDITYDEVLTLREGLVAIITNNRSKKRSTMNGQLRATYDANIKRANALIEKLIIKWDKSKEKEHVEEYEYQQLFGG